MQTPRRLSLKEFADLRTAWIAEHCYTDGEYQKCKSCHGLMEIAAAYMSIHDPRFPGCVGSGKVMCLAIPFCPKCEQRPQQTGCIHAIEMFTDGNLLA
jgi:hypothetical protein